MFFLAVLSGRNRGKYYSIFPEAEALIFIIEAFIWKLNISLVDLILLLLNLIAII